MTAFVEQLITMILAQGALGVFLASVIEEIIVPIPSTIIQTGAAFLFLSGHSFSMQSIGIFLFKIVLPTAAGATIGTLMLYGLAYWGGLPFIQRWGKYFFVTESKIRQAHDTVLSHRSLLWGFCILRFIPLLPNALITAGAGFLRIPFWSYLWTTFIGIFVRALYLGITGWLTGEAYQSLDVQRSFFGMMSSLVLGITVVTVVVTLIVRAYAKKTFRRHR
ncbi:VTT domain-containing protein [Candidatus Nomurabacteria bacterium]|nr:VTT domain-containing protein [Candidatus Nomurabacteria bacterium]